VLVFSVSVLPEVTGQSLVVSRMLHGIDPADVRLVSFGRHDPVAKSPTGTVVKIDDPPPGATRCTTFHVAADWTWTRSTTYPLRHIRAARVFAAEALRRARILIRIARSERCGAYGPGSGSRSPGIRPFS